ncbi:MAG: c-type cytochrome [Thiotrichales bacterium]
MKPLTLALTLAVLSAHSSLVAAAGDPVQGRDKASNCMGCHGVASYFNTYPTYRVPRLGGQHPEYLVAALQGYRSGDRQHSTMQAQAASLSDQDMADLAAFYAGFGGK